MVSCGDLYLGFSSSKTGFKLGYETKVSSRKSSLQLRLNLKMPLFGFRIFYITWRNFPSFDRQCFFSGHRSLDPLYIYSPFDLTVKMLKNDITNPEAFKPFYRQLVSDYTLLQRKVLLTALRQMKRSQRRLFPPSVFVNHTLAVSPR